MAGPVFRNFPAHLVAFLLFFGCAHADVAHQYGGWRTGRSEHFIAHSALSDAVLQATLADLEAVHAVLEQTFFPGTELKNVEVLVFEDVDIRTSTIADARETAVRPAVKGHVLVLETRPGVHTSSLNLSPYSTILQQQAARELLNRFLKINMPHAPAWLRFGLELYVEPVQIDGDIARFGHRLARPMYELGSGRVIVPSALIAGSPAEFHGDWWRSQQASAWAFVHFMLNADGGGMRPQFDTLCRALIDADNGSPQASAAAIAKAFPDLSLQRLDERVRDYAIDRLGRRNFFETMTRRFMPPARVTYPVVPANPELIRSLLLEVKPREPKH